MQIELDEGEIRALEEILHAALQHRGLQVAEVCMHFHRKLRAAMMEKKEC